MTPLQLATLGIRLVALVWAVVAISNAHQWIGYVAALDLGDGTSGLVFLAALQLLTCAVLFMFPATIATMLLPSLRSANAPIAPQPTDWQTIGIICVGLWVLSSALPDAFYWIAYFLVARRSGLDQFLSDPQHVAGVVATVVEVALGFWLTIGGKGLATSLHRIRTAGVRPH